MTRAALIVAAALVWIGAGVLAPPAQAQPDSVRTRILQEKGFDPDHSPKWALWRAAVAPGWGQIYNRDYLKLPFVWGGLAGMGYLVYWMNDQYVLFRHAALFRLGQERMMQDENVTQNEWAQYEEAFNEVANTYGENVSSRRLRERRTSLRSRRDLSIVGTGLFYALTVLDAYVSAHLLTFNVGDDLAVRTVPTGRLPPPATTAALAYRGHPDSPDVLYERAATIGPGVSLKITF